MALTFYVEDVLQAIKTQMLDGTNGFNVKVADINSKRASTDMALYGNVLTLKTLQTGGIYFLVTRPQDEYDPFVTITIDTGDYTKDFLGAIRLKVALRLTLQDHGDGWTDVYAIRYIDALVATFEPGRYAYLDDFFPRISMLETVGYETIADGRSWREVGIKIEMVFASR